MRFATRLVHDGGDPVTGAVSVPIYQSSTFGQKDIERLGRYEYARSGNPTREALETAIANLEGGTHGFAFSSGMAAMTTVLAMFSNGDHLVVGEHIYGGTFRLLTRVLSRFGITASFVDASNVAHLSAAVQPNTKALVLETPSNPFLTITDLRAAAALAQELGLLTIVDNTFMTPYLQRPLKLGCDIVVHSATKFLAGHSDVVAGLAVVRDPQVAAEIAFLQNAIGGVLGPHDVWLVLRGLKTLQVRLDREQATAICLARWLGERPEVQEVFYPGLADHEGHAVHERQAEGPGAVLSFRLATDKLARRFYQQLEVATLAVSLGGVETIISVPARMSHASLPHERRAEMRIDDRLARLSVGLEDPDDLIDDLANALANAT